MKNSTETRQKSITTRTAIDTKTSLDLKAKLSAASPQERRKNLRKLFLKVVTSVDTVEENNSNEEKDTIHIKEEEIDDDYRDRQEMEIKQEDEVCITDSEESCSAHGNNLASKEKDKGSKSKNGAEPTNVSSNSGNHGKVSSTGESKSKEKDKKVLPTEKVLYDNRIKRKNVLALNEKVAALREYEKEPVYKRVGRMFHCSPDQIKRIVQQKDSILKAWEQRTRRSQDAKTLQMKVVRVSMLGKAVYDWLRRMMYYKDFNITDGLIQKMALQFKSAMGLHTFFPHTEWCDKFRQTYNLKESDTKLLSIGYTQGYSVQIKDVIKDILSECTPENGVSEDTNEDNRTDENDNERRSETPQNHQLNSKQINQINQMNQANLTNSVNHLNNQNIQTNNTNNQSNQMLNSLPQLKPGTQLVALPIQGPTIGGSQKVLVATPIATPGQIRNSSSMTMTIIPFATLSQSQLQNNQSKSQQSVVISSINSSLSNHNTAMHSPPGLVAISSKEKSKVHASYEDVKKEIKQEPEDVYIKQECISDTEEDDADSKEFQSTLPPLVPLSNSRQIPKEPPPTKLSHLSNNSVSLNPPQPITIISKEALEQCSATINGSPLDFESMATSSLKKVKQMQNLVANEVGEVSLEASINKSTNAAALAASLGPGVTLTKAAPKLTPAPSSSPKSFQQDTLNVKSVANEQKCKTITPVTPPMPPLMKAPNFNNNLNANKRKRPSTIESQTLPAIRTCTEARRYLKLLEDFALVRENFRLIGLITRADEVLRDLEVAETDRDYRETE